MKKLKLELNPLLSRIVIGMSLERTLHTKALSLLYRVLYRDKIEAARQISHQAIEFAASKLGATRPKLRIEPLPKHIAELEGRRGFCDNNTIYVPIPSDQTESLIVTAHEAAHHIHRQLWVAAEEYRDITQKMKVMKGPAERAAKDFFYMDLKELSPSTFYSYREDEGLVEGVKFGQQTIERSTRKKDKLPDAMLWCGVYIHPSNLISKFHKLEGIEKSFEELPKHVAEKTLPMIQPVIAYHKLMHRINDLDRLEEGWCDFFTYVFAYHQGNYVALSKIKKYEKVPDVDEVYTQGLYLLEHLSQKFGDDIFVLRKSLQFRSIEELYIETLLKF